jgi:hypothetical protein
MDCACHYLTGFNHIARAIMSQFLSLALFQGDIMPIISAKMIIHPELPLKSNNVGRALALPTTNVPHRAQHKSPLSHLGAGFILPDPHFFRNVTKECGGGWGRDPTNFMLIFNNRATYAG